MNPETKKNRERVLAILFLSFAAVLVYNLLTPMITDDFYFAAQSRSASSISGIFQQNYQMYLTWTGRFIPHLLLRMFLVAPMILFKICNALMFALLSVLIYMNIDRRSRWDPFIMLVIQLGLWLFAVDFADTVLWESGAFNYLWAVVLILGFMTLTNRMDERYRRDPRRMTGMILLLFIFGIAAGSSSENTSGGCLLFLLILTAKSIHDRRKVSPCLFAGLAGNIIGLIFMVRAPGNSIRYTAKHAQEAHAGLYGMFSRIQKVTLSIHDCLFVLLLILTATFIITILQMRHDRKDERIKVLEKRIVFTFLCLATAYALVLTPEPQNRALFGAGIFLLIACVQGVEDILENERKTDAAILVRSMSYIAAASLFLYFFFVYVNCGANLARVYRDEKERESYIVEQRDQGSQDITVAQLHPDFDNRYTIIYGADLTADPGYWVNTMYETYFGVGSIKAIPYEEWEKQYGG
jgi:hypothetical protein